MNVGIQTGGLIKHVGIKEGYSMIAEAGFTSIDWNINGAMLSTTIRDGSCVGNALFERPLDEVEAYFAEELAEIRKHNLKIGQAHAPFPAYVTDRPETLDYMINIYKRCIEYCDLVGCPYLIIHGISLTESDTVNTPESIRELNYKLYESLIPTLLKNNVTVCLENLFSFSGRLVEGMCSDAHEAVEFIDTLNAKAGREVFGFCLDTGHLALVRKSFRTYIHTVGHRIKTLHVHDNNATNDHHLMPFTGVINWEHFCDALKDVGYNGDISFETFAQTERVLKLDKDLLQPTITLICKMGEAFKKRIEG